MIPKKKLVVAGSKQQFLTYCKNNYLIPGQDAVYAINPCDFVNKKPEDYEMILHGTWEEHQDKLETQLFKFHVRLSDIVIKIGK
jgi:hypothetical protein